LSAAAQEFSSNKQLQHRSLPCGLHSRLPLQQGQGLPLPLQLAHLAAVQPKAMVWELLHVSTHLHAAQQQAA
jgi:hypothetical protein